MLPVLISDFENVRRDAAESLLRKIREYRPDFILLERDRTDFIDFTFRSSTGLRHAKSITLISGVISLMLCSLSLSALCWAAFQPDKQISAKLFMWFVSLTLIAGPLFYIIRDRYLKWLYSVMASYGTNEQNEALLFAKCVDIYLENKKRWNVLEERIQEATSDIPIMIWKMRMMRIQMMLIPIRAHVKTAWNSFQANFKLKRKP